MDAPNLAKDGVSSKEPMFAAGKTGGGGGCGGVVDVEVDVTDGGADGVLVATSVEAVSRLHGCQAKTAPTPIARTAPPQRV